MKRKELTKAFIMILTLISMVYRKLFQRCKGQSVGIDMANPSKHDKGEANTGRQMKNSSAALLF